jgi:hypothetical protein
LESIRYIREKFSPEQYKSNYQTEVPVPHVYLNDFLPDMIARKMFAEARNTPEHLWTTFDRKGSHMQECNKLEHLPVATEFVNAMHSSLGIDWLNRITGTEGSIGDPFIVGGGYSKSWTNDSLQIHSDFNWNDQFKLHRAQSLIVYLTPDWDPEWGGALEFWDNQKENKVKEFPCLFNSAVIWNYSNRGFHGYPEPLKCPAGVHRTTFRLFYYYSDADYKPEDRPHRSLYWYDKESNEPFDIPTRK